MKIDIKALVQQMGGASGKALSGKWPEVKEYAENEFYKFGQNLALIEKMKLEGTMTLEKARLHVDIQKNAMRMVLLTVEGLGIIAVEQAINAAIDVVRDTVNTSLGWTLL